MAAKPLPQKPAAAPAQPVPVLAKPPEKHNRTQFVREYLKEHPDAKLAEIHTAWKTAGKPMDLAPTQAVLNNVNVERRKQKEGQPAPRARLNRSGQASGQDVRKLDWLMSLEEQLDDAVFKAKEEGDKDLNWIRNLRRTVTYKIALEGGLEDLFKG